MSERRSVNPDELLRQPSHLQIVCTACSLYNWLKIGGAPIPPQVGASLVQSVVDTLSPIETIEKRELAASYGYEVAQFTPRAEFAEVDSLISGLNAALADSPVLLTISTLLSKRDRNAVAILQPSDMKEPERLVTHSVVMAQGTKADEIAVIDPYDPSSAELFDIRQRDERFRLGAWTLSAHYQWLMEQQGKKTKEDLLAFAQWELPQKERLAGNDRMFFGLLQAEPLYLVKNPVAG